MISDNIVLVTRNIAIVQSQGTDCLVPTITFSESPELYETVALPIAKSKTLAEDEFTSIRLTFGSWVKSGDEDEILEEIYKSRLVSSSPAGE